MKMNRYTHCPARRRRVSVLCALMLAVLLAVCAPAAHADADRENVVSPGEVPVVPSASDVVPGEFVRVKAVPANIDIPEFYQEVINVSGMYIFTMPDGTVHKRIYGALDDVFGWYIPVGLDNVVPPGSEPINTTKDSLLYYEAVSEAEREAMYRQDYSGIIPPDEAVTHVDELNGVDMEDITFYCVAGVVLLCLIITIGAMAARNRKPEQDEYGGHR